MYCITEEFSYAYPLIMLHSINFEATKSHSIVAAKKKSSTLLNLNTVTAFKLRKIARVRYYIKQNQLHYQSR